MNLFDLFVKISVDDSSFKRSMENAQKVSKNVATAMKNLQSPLDKAKSGFNAIAHPIETAKANFEKLKNATEAIRHPIETFKNKVADASTALETKRNKLSTLAAGYDSAKKKVADITKEFNKSAKESGTSSQKTQELAKRLNEAEKEAEEAKKELDDYSASVSKAGKNSDSASKGVGNFASKLGKGIATAGKIGVAAVGAAAAGVAALTTAAVNNYAEYEQLVGGVETLFGKSADTVQQYAANAYKTAGLSANEYMSTVTSFSASLLQSLGGDTEAAAKYADMAVSDMSDNANKMGTSMELIQNAYQGFAKQNYTMLDNLKLGYGGTKEEMERLVADAAKVDSSIDKNSLSFGNIVKAINVVQKEMGIYGTTALEAEKTISGSISMTKSAWSNLVTGVADDNADFEKLIDNFVESVGVTANNILPRIQTALEGAGTLVEKLVPVIIEQIPDIVEDTLPKMLESGVKIIQKILEGIQKDPDTIVDTIFEVIEILIDSIVDLLPEILSTGVLLLGKFTLGIIKAIPDLVRRIPEIIRAIKNEFSSHSGEFSNIGDEIINGVWTGIQNAIGWFTDKVSSFFSGIVDSVKSTLGIASPSKVFKAIGGFMAEGLGIGWDDEIGDIQDEINGSLDFGGGSASFSSVGGGVGGRPINITQNIYAQKKSAAQLMQEARWQAQMGVLASV